MSIPHRYIPNQVVKISRGTLDRRPFIVPDAKGELAESIAFIFARSAIHCEIEILALHVEPFGYEAIILDRKMRRSEFLQMVNQAISLKIKKRIKHYESLWSNQKPGNLPILDLETLIEEIFTLCTAPVRNGYVRKIEHWELPTVTPSDWGVKKTYCSCGKDEEDEKASLCPGLTAFLDGDSDLVKMCTSIDAIKASLVDRIQAFEKAERGRRKRVIGIMRCRKKATFVKYKAPDSTTYVDHKRFILCVCKTRYEKIGKFMIRYMLDYNLALIHFILGRSGNFPYGTLKMRTLFRVECQSALDNELFTFLV